MSAMSGETNHMSTMSGEAKQFVLMMMAGQQDV
jgi:hypothetical protein